MTKRYLLYSLVIVLITACNNQSGFTKAEDAQDAGREFIRASLDGDYDKAKFYMLKDEDNLMMLDNWKSIYQKYPQDSVQGFRNADIRPIDIRPVDDSTTLYTYSNSFTKDTTTLKVVRVNNEWLVDLKSLIGE